MNTSRLPANRVDPRSDPVQNIRWAAVLLAIAACGRIAQPDWTYDYPYYFSGLSDSSFAPDLVALISPNGSFNRPIVGLDPATGRARFRIQGTAVSRDDRGALFVAVIARESGAMIGRYALTEIDPRNGSTLRRIALTPALPEYPPVRMAFAGRRLLAIGEKRIAAYSLSDGRLLWSAKADRAALAPPLLLSDRVVLAGESYAAYRLSDGKVLWRADGTCCAMAASPDGKRYYLSDGGRTAVLNADGDKVGSLFGGVPGAFSAHWVAVSGPWGLAVYRHGDLQPTLRLATKNRGHYFSAIALHGDYLLYFDSADKTVWMHGIGDGRRVAVHRSQPKMVVGTDASGVAPAYVDEPPIMTENRIYILDWQLYAYPYSRAKGGLL